MKAIKQQVMQCRVTKKQHEEIGRKCVVMDNLDLHEEFTTFITIGFREEEEGLNLTVMCASQLKHVYLAYRSLRDQLMDLLETATPSEQLELTRLAAEDLLHHL